MSSYNSSLFVAIGAVPGAMLRMWIYLKMSQHKKHNIFYLNIVNTLATFLLGLTLALQSRSIVHSASYPLYLLICVGFLGSLSTFSSIIYELFVYLNNKQFNGFGKNIFISIGLAIIFLLIGYFFGSF